MEPSRDEIAKNYGHEERKGESSQEQKNYKWQRSSGKMKFHPMMMQRCLQKQARNEKLVKV